MARAARYWLIKSEPDAYSIDDLKRDGSTPWEGIRNYQARNFMRDDMRVGDHVLFYHSNADPPGVVGIARVSKPASPDPLQFDSRSRYHDPKSTQDDPRWLLVEIAFVERFDEVIPLATLKETPGLEEMLVTRRGQRLSIQPVTRKEFEVVRTLAGKRSRPKRSR